MLNRFLADELPIEILNSEKDFIFAYRLTVNTHIANEKAAILERMCEHYGEHMAYLGSSSKSRQTFYL